MRASAGDDHEVANRTLAFEVDGDDVLGLAIVKTAGDEGDNVVGRALRDLRQIGSFGDDPRERRGGQCPYLTLASGRLRGDAKQATAMF
jgi:hypothetical protein